MPQGKIDVNDQTATLTIKNSPPIAKNLSEIIAFYCLLVGSDVFANDSTCFILQFEDQLWLIPEEARGAHQLKKILTANTMQAKETIGLINHLPASWRKKFLLIPGIDPDLKLLQPSELDKISSQIEIIENKSLEDVI